MGRGTLQETILDVWISMARRDLLRTIPCAEPGSGSGHAKLLTHLFFRFRSSAPLTCVVHSIRPMFCPRCRAEYRIGFTHCSDCDVDLVGELPLAGHSAGKEL